VEEVDAAVQAAKLAKTTTLRTATRLAVVAESIGQAGRTARAALMKKIAQAGWAMPAAQPPASAPESGAR
jgi:hypothetical protein